MTIFQIIEYIEQKGSRKARIIEMLKEYTCSTIDTGSVVETMWVLPSIARIQREVQENRERSTQFWVITSDSYQWLIADSPRTSTSGAPFIWLEGWAYRIVENNWESNREVVIGDPDGEYTQVYGRMTNGDYVYTTDTSYRPVTHENSPRDILNVPNTQRIEIGEETENNETEFDYSEIDVF